MPTWPVGKEEVQDLEAFMRRSAAIETVFTLAVLYVSVLQIYSPTGIIRHVLLLPVIGLLRVALRLGGSNLIGQLRGPN